MKRSKFAEEQIIGVLRDRKAAQIEVPRSPGDHDPRSFRNCRDGKIVLCGLRKTDGRDKGG